MTSDLVDSRASFDKGLNFKIFVVLVNEVLGSDCNLLSELAFIKNYLPGFVY